VASHEGPLEDVADETLPLVFSRSCAAGARRLLLCCTRLEHCLGDEGIVPVLPRCRHAGIQASQYGIPKVRVDFPDPPRLLIGWRQELEAQSWLAGKDLDYRDTRDPKSPQMNCTWFCRHAVGSFCGYVAEKVGGMSYNLPPTPILFISDARTPPSPMRALTGYGGG
jgi:hypothetical protein